MRRILFTTSVFKDALLLKKKSVIQALHDCLKSEYLEGWILANTTESLLKLGIAKNTILKNLQGFSEIPINARLNNAALRSRKSYENAILEEVVKVFKIDNILGEDFKKHPLYLSYEEIGKLEEDLKIDFMDLRADLHPILNQVDSGYMEIIQNTEFSGGSQVAAFEKEFAAYCGTRYASAVSNGTDALRLALIAMGITKGDEVITAPNTFIATTEVISQLGAKVVFADVLQESYNINPQKIKEKITNKTKAIIPVHLYGQIADMNPILEIAKKHNLQVLEDASQAQGAFYNKKRAGSLGDVAAFSLYPSKNLGAFGEAGIVTSNNKKIIEKIEILRNHGQDKQYSYQMEGYNARMDNLQAVVLRTKLAYLDQWNEKRRKISACYSAGLKNCLQIQTPQIPEKYKSVFYLYPVLAEKVHQLHNYLLDKQIQTRIGYSKPLHLEPAYAFLNQKEGSYPIAESYPKKLICLPIYPSLGEKKTQKVIDFILKFYEK